MTNLAHQLFAQVNLPAPTGSDLMVWLGCAAFVLMLINQGLKVKNSIFPSRSEHEVYPQPLSVKESHALVTEKQCHDRHITIEDQIRDLRSLRMDDVKTAGASREKMYQAMKEVRSELSEAHDRLRNTMAKGFADIERSIGRLEGKSQ